jgi:hypothetical protein
MISEQWKLPEGDFSCLPSLSLMAHHLAGKNITGEANNGSFKSSGIKHSLRPGNMLVRIPRKPHNYGQRSVQQLWGDTSVQCARIISLTTQVLKGTRMSTKNVNLRSRFSTLPRLFAAALFALALGGCASTAPTEATTGPGTPDEIQMQHYEMLKSAIEARSKNDALAALALLHSDVSRWHTDILTVVSAMVDLAAVTDVVESEDWVLAKKKFQELTTEYRGRK